MFGVKCWRTAELSLVVEGPMFYRPSIHYITAVNSPEGPLFLKSRSGYTKLISLIFIIGNDTSTVDGKSLLNYGLVRVEYIKSGDYRCVTIPRSQLRGPNVA